MKKSSFFILFTLLSILSGFDIVSAEVTRPYTVDSKPTVILGDSSQVSNYLGLQNYATDYVGGFLHISYTRTHGQGGWASYPPFLYVTSDNPTLGETTVLYRNLYDVPDDSSAGSWRTDVYFFDIQFSGTGYRIVVTKGEEKSPFIDRTVEVPQMDDYTYIALANNFPAPQSDYSMAFEPKPLSDIPATRITSFNIDTTSFSATVSAHVGNKDIGLPVSFSVSSVGSVSPMFQYSQTATTTDFNYTWSFTDPTIGSRKIDSYIFSARMGDGSIPQQSTSTSILLSPPSSPTGYSQEADETLQGMPDSYSSIFQTLGKGLSGALTSIDLKMENPASDFYGSRPRVSLYECPENVVDKQTFSNCVTIYNGQSDTLKKDLEVRSFWVDDPQSVILKPEKYYVLSTLAENQLNTLPYYAGSAIDTVEGGCLAYYVSTDSISPCNKVSDLYFYLHGVSRRSDPNRFSSVLFLPGIEASRLYKTARADEGGGEKKLWEPTSNENVKELFLDEHGKEPLPLLPTDGVYTRDVLDEAYLSEVGLNIYKSFLSELAGLKSEGKIVDFSAVPYDWRLSLDDILDGGSVEGQGTDKKISYTEKTGQPYIISELARLAESSATGKVTIVAHSNGGLLTKALMRKLELTNPSLAGKVDKIIFVAVPQVGTPSALGALLHGIGQGLPTGSVPFFLSPSVARQFGQNMQAGYNLLPSSDYFTYIDKPVITFDSTLTEWIAKYGEIIHSIERLRDFLAGLFGRVDAGSGDMSKPDSLREELLSVAESEHSFLDKWSSNIPIYQIAGWGVPTTISGISYSEKRCISLSCGGFLAKTIAPEPTWTIDGDGTVVAPSALWMNSNSAQRFWVDLKGYNNEHFDINHKNILEIDELLSFVKSILTDKSIDILPHYISRSAPIADPQDTRLVYSLRAGQSLNLYDEAGRHTGISTSTGAIEENIPGTYFVSAGDETYVFSTEHIKNIVTISPPSGLGPISQEGSDFPPFTFRINQYSGDDLVASSTFKDITSGTTTTAYITFENNDITTGSPLLIDQDGDGTYDMTLNIKINGIVTMPQESSHADPGLEENKNTEESHIVGEGSATSSNEVPKKNITNSPANSPIASSSAQIATTSQVFVEPAGTQLVVNTYTPVDTKQEVSEERDVQTFEPVSTEDVAQKVEDEPVSTTTDVTVAVSPKTEHGLQNMTANVSSQSFWDYFTHNIKMFGVIMAVLVVIILLIRFI